jgi:molybdopterin molybdotransferase
MNLISAKEAREIVLNNVPPLNSIKEELTKTIGSVLMQDIIADTDLPPFDRVAMDGIAIRFSEDGDFSGFTIQDTQAAGEKPKVLLAERHAIEVMTGAVLPIGTETVIQYENIDIVDDKATVKPQIQIKKGQNIHLQGTDRQSGDTLVGNGAVISPSILAIAASAGYDKLRIVKPPKVCILSTGNELVKIDQKPKSYQLRRSNPYLIGAALTNVGLNFKMDHLKDSKKDIYKKLKHWIRKSDIIVLSGGVSKGKFDYIPECAAELGFTPLFHGVLQRPGMPFWFGVKDSKILFALPGNPVSTAACTAYYVMPFLHACMGKPPESCSRIAMLSDDVHFDKALTRLMPVELHHGLDGRLYAFPIPGKGSGDFSSLKTIVAFSELEPEKDFFPKGTLVMVHLL